MPVVRFGGKVVPSYGEVPSGIPPVVVSHDRGGVYDQFAAQEVLLVIEGHPYQLRRVEQPVVVVRQISRWRRAYILSTSSGISIRVSWSGTFPTSPSAFGSVTFHPWAMYVTRSVRSVANSVGDCPPGIVDLCQGT